MYSCNLFLIFSASVRSLLFLSLSYPSLHDEVNKRSKRRVRTLFLFFSKGLEIPRGFLGTSAGKEPACNVGDPSWIPGSGRSPVERIGYPLQYSWTSLVAQIVKNPPAMRETWVQSLGWEDPLEKGMAPRSSILAWRIPMVRVAWWAIVHGVPKSYTQLSD